MGRCVNKNKHKTYLWHQELHQNCGQENLYFLRFFFAPIYKREEVLAGIQRVLYDYHVESFALYEMTGEYDILLRVWMKKLLCPHAFATSFVRELSPCHIRACDPPFQVTDYFVHWVWDNDGTEHMRTPSPQTIQIRLSDTEIKKINDRVLSEDEYTKYEKQNIIAACTPGDGIKFVIRIPYFNVNLDGYTELLGKIQKVLRDAKGVSEISIYAGIGFARILILGRLNPETFDASLSKIILQLNDTGLRGLLQVRTHTHICLNSTGELLKFQDRLNVDIEEKQIKSIEELLEEKESNTLEVKGTTFVDINRWILGDGKIVMSDKITNEGVLKAIVGLLNAQGGEIVVGALEKSKYKNKKAKDKLIAFPICADYILCGIEMDYQDKDWDFFQLRLQDILQTRINPSPSPWINVKREQFKGKDMCVLSIRQPNRNWFYVVDEHKLSRFYVREGGRTRELSGSEADLYKSTNPRYANLH